MEAERGKWEILTQNQQVRGAAVRLAGAEKQNPLASQLALAR
jgi:hypothetical protein